jgi:hypothetical protein
MIQHRLRITMKIPNKDVEYLKDYPEIFNGGTVLFSKAKARLVGQVRQ